MIFENQKLGISFSFSSLVLLVMVIILALMSGYHYQFSNDITNSAFFILLAAFISVSFYGGIWDFVVGVLGAASWVSFSWHFSDLHQNPLIEVVGIAGALLIMFLFYPVSALRQDD